MNAGFLALALTLVAVVCFVDAARAARDDWDEQTADGLADAAPTPTLPDSIEQRAHFARWDEQLRDRPVYDWQREGL